MREGAERERWDRLSFQLANIATLAGAKNVDISSFNKFDIMDKQEKPEDIDTKAVFQSLKGSFPQPK